jgi:hypothetical protein
VRQGTAIRFDISRTRLRQVWYKCPPQKKIEGSQQQSTVEAPPLAYWMRNGWPEEEFFETVGLDRSGL